MSGFTFDFPKFDLNRENLKYEILRNIKFQESWEAFRIVDKVWLYRLGGISDSELSPR